MLTPPLAGAEGGWGTPAWQPGHQHGSAPTSCHQSAWRGAEKHPGRAQPAVTVLIQDPAVTADAPRTSELGLPSIIMKGIHIAGGVVGPTPCCNNMTDARFLPWTCRSLGQLSLMPCQRAWPSDLQGCIAHGVR